MLFAAVFFINAAGNFAFGIALSALLGPAQSGRYSTAALLAGTLSAAMFEWLRQSSLRFSGDHEGRANVAASLDLAYLLVMGGLFAAAGVSVALGYTFGLGAVAFLLTPLLAVGLSRVDFAGALLRAREQAAPFAWLYGVRQALAFTVVLTVAWRTRDATMTVAALTLCTILPPLVLSAPARTPGAALSHASRQRVTEFFLYAKPIVIALVLYQLVILINRKVALTTLGAEATGQLSLASDLVQRLFFAMNTVPELLLFQYALRRDREEGLAAAKQQIGVNMVLSLALLAPMMTGFIAMMPTFEALLVPRAFHGDFARLAVEFAPGFLAFCTISSALNPVFQLGRKTWPVTLAALAALVTDLLLLALAPSPLTTDWLAESTSISLGVGLLVAGAIAFRDRAFLPRWRDVGLVVIASAAMGLAVQPLNGLASPALASMIAVVLGGAIYAGILLAFDVAGLRRSLFILISPVLRSATLRG